MKNIGGNSKKSELSRLVNKKINKLCKESELVFYVRKNLWNYECRFRSRFRG